MTKYKIDINKIVQKTRINGNQEFIASPKFVNLQAEPEELQSSAIGL